MPRETVEIPITLVTAPFEAVSILLSYVAYPDNHDKTKRFTFGAALCRHAHLLQARADKTWNLSLQPVRPFMFNIPDKILTKSKIRGANILYLRILTSCALLSPHLKALETNKLPEPVRGFAPTVANMSELLIRHLGWTGDSESTFKSKIWGPTKPVAHLAYALLYSFLLPLYKKDGRLDDSETIPLDIDDLLTPSPAALLAILITAENVRRMLPELKQFRFKEQDIIEFVPI